MYEYAYDDNVYSKEYLDKRDIIENFKEENQHLRQEIDIAKEVYNNVKIEGNSLSKIDITQYLQNDVTVRSKPLRDFLQVRNCANALEMLKSIVMDPELPLTKELITNVHAILTEGELKPEESGHYRKEDVSIRTTDYIPPIAESVEGHMEELISKYNNKDHLDATPFERICEFKRNFERIHPFIDGNGRTGRLVANILFLQNGYPYVSFPFEEREIYFDAIENNTLCDYLSDRMIVSIDEIKGKQDIDNDNEIVDISDLSTKIDYEEDDDYDEWRDW